MQLVCKVAWMVVSIWLLRVAKIGGMIGGMAAFN